MFDLLALFPQLAIGAPSLLLVTKPQKCPVTSHVRAHNGDTARNQEEIAMRILRWRILSNFETRYDQRLVNLDCETDKKDLSSINYNNSQRN